MIIARRSNFHRKKSNQKKKNKMATLQFQITVGWINARPLSQCRIDSTFGFLLSWSLKIPMNLNPRDFSTRTEFIQETLSLKELEILNFWILYARNAFSDCISSARSLYGGHLPGTRSLETRLINASGAIQRNRVTDRRIDLLNWKSVPRLQKLFFRRLPAVPERPFTNPIPFGSRLPNNLNLVPALASHQFI